MLQLFKGPKMAELCILVNIPKHETWHKISLICVDSKKKWCAKFLTSAMANLAILNSKWPPSITLDTHILETADSKDLILVSDCSEYTFLYLL